ncbi:MAG: RNA-binding S4 domain-containing protein [Desulfuromonadales bacterium]|nr:RNA-binding S4 domain-containing protein [Desulfuromonadales bacterium]
MLQFNISTEYIKLDSFLKAVSAVGSGGEAKIVIADGMVLVNGETELRRGRKLFTGDRVAYAGKVYLVERES